MKHFSEVFIPPKSPPPQSTLAAPVGRKLVIPKSPKPEPVAEDAATASVRAGLQSVLSTVNGLSARLNGWSPDTGSFADGGKPVGRNPYFFVSKVGRHLNTLF